MHVARSFGQSLPDLAAALCDANYGLVYAFSRDVCELGRCIKVGHNDFKESGSNGDGVNLRTGVLKAKWSKVTRSAGVLAWFWQQG